ncbi:hypothetical protein GPECTOR_30g204 [Gonium pectorale]|uniref:Ankyrin repeat domain-containing protein n=1 Tax=Gonium pectorale TaxID=33097 RepID=A0A150GE44_GONPE|nr:hypothetical protein GPECTOR_30g204 [Gonium pectorale]|eukprot:KXZ48109.1 hypothetical protein GPECTOR_30g204 [Gonium pectorale]
MAAAAGSPTPDWRAKVEWLEARGYPRTDGACAAVAGLPDAMERLAWLRQRGHPVSEQVVVAAGRAGNLTMLQFLQETGTEVGEAVWEAASGGHLHVVAWLVEAPGVEVQPSPALLDEAALSGNLELLAWLCERGCAPHGGSVTLDLAAAAGNVEALEWLVERGWAMGDDGQAYINAASNNDPATLHCLVRLGCPWGQPDSLFRYLVCAGACPGVGLPMLRALLRAGLPLDWEAAAEAATWGQRGEERAVLAMLREERARRQEQQLAARAECAHAGGAQAEGPQLNGMKPETGY